ncbi:hypothetical protein FB567DRAFT_272913 [Paraphoma chrysanthemicola]|uniref:F-box domain-containing protein n=1 Tax=Paraphoma chrysanthemicola TaxID=798071 RepID=A0A8K0RCI1_9PLEO|nr:hypothetical protein FB567DRAFT_272913 [Paraphoma chrysanthemicola]
MGLLDLPPEILDLIIDHTAPLGLQNFVLSCKVVYERAKAQVEQHKQMTRRWRQTSNASPALRGDTLSILYEISRQPLIAEYIETLSLWDRRTSEEVETSTDAYSFRDDAEALSKIKRLLSAAEYFASADVEEWWHQILEEDRLGEEPNVDKLYATVALLSLLPNLKTLQLPDRWHEVRKNEAAEALVPSVEALITMSNSSTHSIRPLAALETLLPFVEEGYDIKVGLQCLVPFMALKSIRNLFAVSCVAVNDDWAETPFEWPLSAPKSPLTRIELASCCMDAGGLSVLFANTPALTIFRYSHQTKWDGVESDWNPGEILEVLANYHGSRLLELAITVDELHGEVINGLSSFMRFEKLEKLEVDVIPFCGPPMESGQRLGRNAYIPEGAKAWTYIDIPCMGDMLPRSIRELQCNTDYPEPSAEALRALFKNIKDRRQDKLLRLHKTVIRQYRSSSVQQLADDHDMILEVFDEDSPNPRPRSMMPEWKRNFDARVGGIVMTTGT